MIIIMHNIEQSSFRYVYGTMIGESMTRDTKSAGAGAMRVVVGHPPPSPG